MITDISYNFPKIFVVFKGLRNGFVGDFFLVPKEDDCASVADDDQEYGDKQVGIPGNGRTIERVGAAYYFQVIRKAIAIGIGVFGVCGILLHFRTIDQ